MRFLSVQNWVIVLTRSLFLLIVLVVSNQTQAQQTSAVRGQVTDDKGEELPGVSVVLKGPRNGDGCQRSLLIKRAKQWRHTGFLLRASGSWEEVFGKGLATDELFIAWHFAKYANAVTEAGKKVYPLPMFVNAALNRTRANRL